MPSAGLCPSPLLALLLGAALSPLSGPAATKIEMTVQLPPFIVETTVGPSWRYTRTPRFEILSRCDALTTDRLKTTFHRANEFLGLVLPERFQLRLDTPQMLIFYDKKLWPEAERDAVAVMLQANATAPFAAGGAKLPSLPVSRAGPATANFFSNLLLTDADPMTTFALISASSAAPEESHLTSAYVETLLRGRVPALPTWFIPGFLRFYSRLEFRPTGLVLPANRWETLRRQKPENKAGPQFELLPWAKFFDGQTNLHEADLLTWLNQADLFISWGMDPAGERTAGFWQFVERASRAPISEAVFQECFGFEYSEATTRLNTYLLEAAVARWPLSDNPAQSPDFPTRNATFLEIAVIKGEWERLETRYVRKNEPELADSYLALARRTLHMAYDRHERDPRLLTTLGLLELEAGNKQEAGQLLELAAEQGTIRPRANFELARLRYDALWGRSTRNDGKLTPEQAGTILGPLLTAARQAPPLAAVYELMGHVCFNSTEPPSAEVLAALAEGEELFPGRKFIPKGH